MTKKPVKPADWAFVLSHLVDAEFYNAPHTAEGFRAWASKKFPGYAALAARLGRFQELGLTYQEMLFALMVGKFDKAPPVVVETGVRTGVSTRFILTALQTIAGEKGDVELYSCDPIYASTQQALDKLVVAFDGVGLPQVPWTFYPKRSVDCLLEIAQKRGGWDLFLHDSDHNVECMTFELEFGWSMLRPGGVLICDDWNFPFPNGNPHGAFETFVKRRGLEWHDMGGAAVIFKPAATDGLVKLSNEEVDKLSLDDLAGALSLDHAVSLGQPDPKVAFKAAILVAVNDLKSFSRAAPPTYATYLEG